MSLLSWSFLGHVLFATNTKQALTWVHNAILEDLVFPTEITAKSLRVSTDGSKLVRCSLDSKDATSLEYKLETFSSVYRKLTGKDVAFMI